MPEYIKIEESLETSISQPHEINDLIGNAPKWIIRSGITVIALVVVVGLIMSYLISYPDKITAPVIITTQNPPVDLVSNSSGKLTELFITDKDTILKNDTLLYIENTAIPDDIHLVEKFIRAYESITFVPDYLKINFPSDLQTGELNNSISLLGQKFRAFQNLLMQGLVFQKLKSIDNEISRTHKLTKIQERQLQIYKNEVDIKTKEYSRNKTLHNQHVISDQDIEKSEAELLGFQRNLENMRTGVINNNIRIEQLNTQKIELADQRQQAVAGYINELGQLIIVIKNEIEAWKRKYYIVAPISGVVNLSGNITKDLYVKQTDILCSIVPASDQKAGNKKIARAMTPIGGTGKIEKGARVIIRFDAFPYKEYGIIESKVENIALLPMQDKENKLYYELSFPLPDKLITNYNKTLEYKPNMSGEVLIITKERTLLERFFDKFLNLTKNN